MKKRIAWFLILCMAAVSLMGCSKGKGGEQSPEEAAADTIETDAVTIGQYKGLTYTPTSASMTDEEYEEQVAELLSNAGTREEIKDRDTVEMGDDIVFDFTGKKDDVPFEGGSSEDFEAVVGETGFITGFDENLVGAKVGKEFDFDITFPEDYGKEELNGQEVTFTILVKGIYEYVPAELNDDFVTSQTDYASVDEFNANYRKDLEASQQEEATNTDKQTVWDQVMANSEVKEYDQTELDYYKEDITSYYEEMAEYYQMEFDEFCSSYLGTTPEDFETQTEDYAQNLVKEDMVVNAIADKEGLQLTDEDLTAGYQRFSDDYEMDETAVNDYFGSEDKFKTELLYEKVVEYVFGTAVAQ